eukprot:6200042-Pleurochrysis_carterae.AAC.1
MTLPSTFEQNRLNADNLNLKLKALLQCFKLVGRSHFCSLGRIRDIDESFQVPRTCCRHVSAVTCCHVGMIICYTLVSLSHDQMNEVFIVAFCITQSQTSLFNCCALKPRRYWNSIIRRDSAFSQTKALMFIKAAFDCQYTAPTPLKYCQYKRSRLAVPGGALAHCSSLLLLE